MGHVQPQVGQKNSKFRLYLHALQQDRTRENISEMFINVCSHVGGLFIVTVVEKAPFMIHPVYKYFFALYLSFIKRNWGTV